MEAAGSSWGLRRREGSVFCVLLRFIYEQQAQRARLSDLHIPLALTWTAGAMAAAAKSLAKGHNLGLHDLHASTPRLPMRWAGPRRPTPAGSSNMHSLLRSSFDACPLPCPPHVKVVPLYACQAGSCPHTRHQPMQRKTYRHIRSSSRHTRVCCARQAGRSSRYRILAKCCCFRCSPAPQNGCVGGNDKLWWCGAVGCRQNKQYLWWGRRRGAPGTHACAAHSRIGCCAPPLVGAASAERRVCSTGADLLGARRCCCAVIIRCGGAAAWTAASSHAASCFSGAGATRAAAFVLCCAVLTSRAH